MEDIIIIGGGPIGIYSALLASLHNLKGILLEARSGLGGQLSFLYPDKTIVDIPAQKAVTARELVALLADQLSSQPNHPEIHLDESVRAFFGKEDHYVVETSKGEYETKTILIVSGMGNFTPRKIGLPNEDSFKNIIYAVQDKCICDGKDIVILGGGDSAVDWALTLLPTAKSVSIVHHRNEFRAQAQSVEEMKAKGVRVYTPFSVTSLIGENGTLRQIKLTDALTGAEKTLSLDILLVNYGMAPSANTFPVDKKGVSILVRDFYMTSAENVFAIGNAISYPGKVKNITCGFGEAVVAVTRIDQIINPTKNIPVHF